MKVFKCNKKNVAWYKKLDYIQIIIVSIFTLLISLFCLNFIGKDFDRALKSSILITCLIILYLVIKNLIEDREAIYLVDDKKIKYIDYQRKREGTVITDLRYNEIVEKVEPEDIIKNIDQFDGVTVGEIKKIYKIKKRVNKTIVVADVDAKLWKIIGFIRINGTELITKQYKKKFIITRDYDNYEELVKAFVNLNGTHEKVEEEKDETHAKVKKEQVKEEYDIIVKDKKKKKTNNKKTDNKKNRK